MLALFIAIRSLDFSRGIHYKTTADSLIISASFDNADFDFSVSLMYCLLLVRVLFRGNDFCLQGGDFLGNGIRKGCSHLQFSAPRSFSLHERVV